MVVSFKAYAKKISNMRKLLNRKGITDEEKQTLVSTIKDEIETFKKFKDDTKLELKLKVEDIKQTKKRITTKKKDLIKKLRKTVKNIIKDNKKEAKKQKKLEKSQLGINYPS